MYKKVLVVVLLLLLAFLISCGGGKKQPVNGTLSTAIGDSAAAPDEMTIMRPAPWSGDRDTADLEGNFTRPEPAKTTSAISGPRFTPTSDSIRQGLEYMKGVRGTFPFPQLADAPYPNVWEWYVGQGKAYLNIQGVVASGMLRASLTQGENTPGYLAEAMKTVDDFIVPVFTEGPQSAATSRPYAHDVYSLYLAYEKTGDSSYIELAKTLVHRTMDVYTGAEYADRMIVNRYSMAGWDAAAYIYAFYLAGEATEDLAIKNWAVAMADRMVDRWGDWDHKVVTFPTTSTWAYDWSMLSYGGMIKALTIVPDVNGKGYADKIAYMKNAALAAQDVDEGWFPVWYGAGPNASEYDDVQATAYLLEALNIDNDSSTMYSRILAEGYLRAEEIQMSDGNFVTCIGDTGYVYPEVCSEVLMALASMPLEQNSLTGGGWINGKVSGKAQFGFNVKVENGAVVGSVNFTDSDSAISFDSSYITYFYASGNTGYFVGYGNLQGTGQVFFFVHCTDNGEPGKNNDKFRIFLGDYDNEGLLGGGNIKVHKK